MTDDNEKRYITRAPDPIADLLKYAFFGTNMNRDYSLNLKLWGSLLALVTLSSGIGLYTASTAVSRFTGARASSIAQNNQLAQLDRQQGIERAQIETEANKTQAKIDNNINLYDSVTLPWYSCDAMSPPNFDPKLYAQPDRKVNVADRNQRVVGEIMPSGNFYFLAENC